MSGQRRGNMQRAVFPLYRSDPFRDIQQTNDRLSDLIRTFFGDTAAWSPAMMPVDIEETDDSYVVDIDLPNVNPDDITLEMRGEELRIAGRYQTRERTGTVRRQNRPEGEFEYEVDLPSDVDPNMVDATYDSGVLTITLGKTREAQPRRIEIHASQHRMGGNGQQAM
jgi:HSP20 family protein